MSDIRPAHQTHQHGSWEKLEARLSGIVPALGLFAALYLPTIVLDHALSEAPHAATVLRPSIGLLLIALWFSRTTRWPGFLVIHAASALLVEWWLGGALTPGAASQAILPGAVSALVGALACRQILRKPLTVQVAQVPRAMIGVVLGALCGAATTSLLHSLGSMPPTAGLADFWQHAVEYALGALTSGPVVLTWLLQQQRPAIPELVLRSRSELAWLTLWIVAPIIAGWIFLRGASSSLLPVPLVAGPALIVASLRLPPRWAVALAALFVVPFSILATSREAPYSVADPAVRIGLQQMLAGIFVVVPFILSVGITQLRMAMSRLTAERARLQAYAQRVSVAEEKARRATAIDLHDGIGQTLVGMQMMVDVARQHPPRSVDALLSELGTRLRDIQEHTRRMITDLSPPGLYDLGLGAALQWLVLHLREQDGLKVVLSCEVNETAIPENARVLAFRIARELLRNIVRHAGVRDARVEVRGDSRALHLTVSDSGRGFDPQLSTSPPGRGFGLWSIAERVRESGGQFKVSSAPGSGSTFEVELPLRPE